MMKSAKFVSVLLALLIAIFALPISVAAKCPDVPSDLVCAELHYFFLPSSPLPGEEVTVIAYWLDQRTAAPVTNVEWLARRGKPAYLWLWDHEPSELETIAHVDGFEEEAKLPQILVPLRWDAKEHKYQGAFVFPNSGWWHFRLGTVVPAALRTSMEADSDYAGAIQTINISAATEPMFRNGNWSIWLLGLVVGSALAVSVLLWRIRFSQRHRSSHPVS